MNAKALDGIREQLQNERTQIESQVASLLANLEHLEADLARIAAAIAALEGNQPPALRTRAPKEKPRKKSSAPAAAKADVIRWMEQVLRQEQGLPRHALRSLVEDEVTKAGFTRMGFSLRFREALADPRFEEHQGEVRLTNRDVSSH